MLPDLRITKESGLGRRSANTDAIVGMIMQGVATVYYSPILGQNS